MGQAVIGGVITSSLLTLVVVPVVYCYMDDLASWLQKRDSPAARCPLKSGFVLILPGVPRIDHAHHELEQARFNMIEQQIRPWDVLDPAVLPCCRSSSAKTSCRWPTRRWPSWTWRSRCPAASACWRPRVEARLLQDLAGAKARKGAGNRRRLGLHGRAAGPPGAARDQPGHQAALARWRAPTCKRPASQRRSAPGRRRQGRVRGRAVRRHRAQRLGGRSARRRCWPSSRPAAAWGPLWATSP
jgi:hypothetical protein